MINFRDIIALWGEYGGPTQLHKDLNHHMINNGLDPITIYAVRAWKRKNDNPFKYWQHIIDVARENKVKMDRKMLKMEMFQEAHRRSKC